MTLLRGDKYSVAVAVFVVEAWNKEALDDLFRKDERGSSLTEEHMNCFKDNVGETSERWDGAHNYRSYFHSERIHSDRDFFKPV